MGRRNIAQVADTALRPTLTFSRAIPLKPNLWERRGPAEVVLTRFMCSYSIYMVWFIGVLRHMQRYFSHICDGTDVQAD